jgi:hypothetical protein
MRSVVVLLLFALSAPALVHADPYPQAGACDSAGQPALHRVEVTGGSEETTV